MFGLGLKGRFQRLVEDVRFGLRNRLGRPRLYDLSTPERVGCVYRVPSDMCAADRILLYALVRGLRPARALEIGARWGNSARIMANAMEENGFGQAVGIDPEPAAFRTKPRELHGRYRLLRGFSPQAIPEAVAALGGPLDFVFIDALHIYDAVLADLRGVLPHVAPGAHILLHDSFHPGVDAAIEETLRSRSDLVDLGLLSRHPQFGDPVAYEGMRLLRAGASPTREILADACRRAGRPEPRFDRSLWNHDEFYLRMLRESPDRLGPSSAGAEGTKSPSSPNP